MSFFSVPESSAGYSSYVLPPRLPVIDVEARDADSKPTGCCYTCLYWMFRSIPVLIFFLMINCVRAILFDQRTAFTIINITLGVTLFAVITISLYTFISLKFYRLQQSQATFLPATNPIAIIGNSTQQTSSPSNSNYFAYHTGQTSSGHEYNNCARCAARSSSSTLLAENTSASTSAGSARTHAPHCPHYRTRPRKTRMSADDLPPKYEDLEEPPKYEELSAADLVIINDIHYQNVDDLSCTTKTNSQWISCILYSSNTFFLWFSLKTHFWVFVCFVLTSL